MTGSRADTAAQFSRQAEAYATRATHAGDADLDIVTDFAAAGSRDRCLDVACGTGHGPRTTARVVADRIVRLHDQRLIVLAAASPAKG